MPETITPRAIVFDSNAYRGLVEGLSLEDVKRLASTIRIAESGVGIDTYAHAFVACELLAHLADPADRAFDRCRKAISALWIHCLNPATSSLRFVPDPETQFSKEFFDYEDPRKGPLYAHIIGLCAFVHNADEADDLSSKRSELEGISLAVQQTEDNFLSDVWTHVIQANAPGATSWKIFETDRESRQSILTFLRSTAGLTAIAVSNVRKFALIAGETPSIEDILAKANWLREHYPTSLSLYRDIVTRIVTSGCDLSSKNRVNWIWDMQIGFFLSPHAAVGDKYFGLVTDDGDIIDAAEEAGASGFVSRLSEYRTRLGL